MNARDALLYAVDNDALKAKDILREILTNWMDIDEANDCAYDMLVDNNMEDGFDPDELD